MNTKQNNSLARLVRHLCCLLGRHKWIYDHPNCNHHRNCKPCGRWEAYTLKLWLKYTPPPKPPCEKEINGRATLIMTLEKAIEKGAGWVRAERPDGTVVGMHEDETDFEEQVRAAVRLAGDEIAAATL